MTFSRLLSPSQVKEALRGTFETDWAICRAAHGLETMIENLTAELAAEAANGLDVVREPPPPPSTSGRGGRGKGGSRRRLRGGDVFEGVAEAVGSCRDVVWEWLPLIYGAFDYYSALYCGTADEHGEWGRPLAFLPTDTSP